MATAERKRGACTVTLYDKGCKFAMAYPGHGCKFTAAKTHAAKRWRCYRVPVSTEKIITSAPDQQLVDAIEYRDLPGGGGFWSVAHYPDAAQVIELADWTQGTGTWEEIDDPDYDGKLLHQRDSTATSGQLATCELTSKFVLPSNPYILLNLWRAEPPKDADRLAYEPYTRISFGLDGAEFALVIPYGGEAPFVQYWEPADSAWHRLEAESGGSLQPIDGISKGQRLWITIRVLLGKLLVSFSRSQNQESGVLYKLPDKEWKFIGVTAYRPSGWEWVDKPLAVKSGPIVVQHNAGQIAVRWWPLYCPSGAQYLWYLGEQETGYTCWQTTAPGLAGGNVPAACQMLAANCDAYYYPIWGYQSNNAGVQTSGWTVLSATPTVTPYNPQAGTSNADTYTAYSWYSAITPVQFALGSTTYGSSSASYYPNANCGGVGDILHSQSPILMGVQVRTEPYVAQLADDWPTGTDITSHVQGVSVQYAQGSPGGTATLKLKGTASTLTMHANQMIEIALGYLWSDGETRTATVFCGYVGTPGYDGSGGPKITSSVVAYDPVTRLRGEKAQDLEPDFQTFTPKGAIAWLLKRSGFTDDQMSLLGSDAPMYLGSVAPDGTQTGGGLDADNDALILAFGTELVAGIEELCRRDNESEWWIIPDATHKFKLYKRAGQMGASDGTLFELKEDAPIITDPTAPDLRLLPGLTKETAQMDAGEYADCVIIKTQDPDGNAIHQTASAGERWYDTTDADYSGGWRHMYCEARDAVQSDSLATQRATEILAKRGRRPIIIKATTDVLGAIIKGERLHITNVAASGVAHRLNVRSTTLAPVHFRVVGYEHSWDRGSWPVTTITARSIDS